MFNYIKDAIINDIARVSNGLNAAGNAPDTNLVVIKRVGNYDCRKIVDKKVFKMAGNTGTCAVLKVPANLVDNDYDYVQYCIFVDTPSKELVDYAYPNWQAFGKPIVVESGSTTVDGIADAFRLALPNDNPFYKVSKNGNDIVLTFAEPWMRVKELRILMHDVENDKMVPYDSRTFDALLTTKNVEEFATGKWLVENLRFPSYPNRRYAGLYSDETPVEGTVYTQYAFQYGVKHAVPGGLSSVGQVVDSVTTHVFYVPSASAKDFEDFFTAGGCEIVEAKLSNGTNLDVVSSMDPRANDVAAVAGAAGAASTLATTNAGKFTALGTAMDDTFADEAALASAIATAVADPAEDEGE